MDGGSGGLEGVVSMEPTTSDIAGFACRQHSIVIKTPDSEAR